MITLLTIILASFLGLVLAYKYLLAGVGLLGTKITHRESGNPEQRFGIVIPAYNEETSIAQVIESCHALDYPTDRVSVFVIADNCSDGTAALARSAGAFVLERSDPVARGKGHALQWAFEQIVPMDLDALVVIDADCVIEPHALRTFAAVLAAGQRVLQCSYVVANPDEGVMSYISALGNVIENDLFYTPKSRLGLAVLLRGTGMVFHREILERFPWTAHSITEDVEYALQLIRNGVRITFLPDVRVLSPFPVTTDQIMIQRRRWAAGTVGVGKEALRSMADGTARRSLMLLDAGWTLLILSRPLLLILVMLLLLISLLSWGLSPSGGTAVMVGIAGIEVLLLFVYLVLGILRLGLNTGRILFLGKSPLVLARLAWASIQGIVGVDRSTWRRTPRSSEVCGGSR